MTPGQVCKSGRQSHRNVDNRKTRVVAVVPTANLDLGLKLMPCPNQNRLRQNVASPRLLGCQAVQGTVRTVFIEPGSEVVQPTLDLSLRQAFSGALPPTGLVAILSFPRGRSKKAQAEGLVPKSFTFLAGAGFEPATSGL